MPEIFRRTIPATTVGAYLVCKPEEPRPAPMLVGFDGYGQNAEACMAELERIPGSSALLLVAVQALHRFYDRKHDEVVGRWMTKLDREQAIADNERYGRGLRDDWYTEEKMAVDLLALSRQRLQADAVPSAVRPARSRRRSISRKSLSNDFALRAMSMSISAANAGWSSTGR
jgi:hypothetical protein